jgi:hypothetical protein
MSRIKDIERMNQIQNLLWTDEQANFTFIAPEQRLALVKELDALVNSFDLYESPTPEQGGSNEQPE